MTKVSPKKIITAVLLVTLSIPLMICGCKGSEKQKALKKLTETLHGDYSCEISFNIPEGNPDMCGSADITRSGSTTTLDIHAPEPYTGMSIEYDVKGMPSSIAVHFRGIDANLPQEALSRVNSIAMLFADDFVSSLEKINGESITEYELEDKSTGGCLSLLYDGADITLYFALDTSIPLSLEYRSKNVNADIIFESFNPYVKTAE